jgi:DNA uptake protein ComE-like DNA-binding protein
MGKTFRQSVIDYFSFLRNDRNGVITLIILILFVITGHVIISQMNFMPGTDFTEAKKALESWENQKSVRKDLGMFVFDPNTVSEEQLDSLDLPVPLKRNLLKYRAAGGKFTKPADFRKLYGMNDSLYLQLEPFITINGYQVVPAGKGGFQAVKNELPALSIPRRVKAEEDQPAADSSTFPGKKILNREILVVELNAADSTELTRLYGIGPVFASRIIKYRNLLGGFYSPAQLNEVYGMREETMNLIRNHVTVDTSHIKPLRVNFDDFRDLLRHPYLEKHHVEAILNYRSLNGPFSSVEQILKNGLLDSATYAGIKPYLTCR